MRSLIDNIDIKVALASLISIITALAWEITLALQATFAIYLIDFALWVSVSIYKGTFSLERFREWITKFTLYGIAIVVANQIDIVLWEFLNVVNTKEVHVLLAKYWVTAYIAIHETLSVIRKLSKLWLKLPQTIVNKLLYYRDVMDDKKWDNI